MPSFSVIPLCYSSQQCTVNSSDLCQLLQRWDSVLLHLVGFDTCLSVLQHDRSRFTCTICEATFKWKGNLTLHMKLHSGEGLHECEVCGALLFQSCRIFLVLLICKKHKKTAVFGNNICFAYLQENNALRSRNWQGTWIGTMRCLFTSARCVRRRSSTSRI